jgi:hypothetical protein
MSRFSYHTFRTEPTAIAYIEEVYKNHERYNSIKHFSEQAVANNSKNLEHQFKGAADLRRLIQALCRVDGIRMEPPEKSFNTKLKDENLTSATKIELTPQQLKSIQQITTATELSKGGAIRVCLVRELYKISSEDWVLHEPRKSDIESSWYSIENSVEDMFSSLYSKLETKVVKQLDSTQEKLKEDPKAREEVIAHYKNYFQGSSGYERLQKTDRGKAILEGIESLPHGDG